jgi:hypothetical protein
VATEAAESEGVFELDRETRYETTVAAPHGRPPSKEPESRAPSEDDAEHTPVSSSGVVVRTEPRTAAGAGAPRKRRRESFRPLMPYQARLDVEMDDTAISKVRDPSVSINLDPEDVRGEGDVSRRDAIVSTVVGAGLGALLVGVVILLVRACS